ncbi:Fc.00g074410.m01.CDS01 [Cosmosporella sp. VM-42]
MRLSSLGIVLGSSVWGVLADETTYDQNAGCNKDQLLRWFNSNTGLWYNNQGSPYWWQGANMLTTLAKYGKLNSGVASQLVPIISAIYSNAPKNKPFARVAPSTTSKSASTSKVYTISTKFKRQQDVGFENTFYDDEGWWGLGFIAAWEMTGNINYLNEAIYIWNDMHAAWGSTPCGGLWWNKNSGSPVVAISNELYLHLSAAIANNVGNDVKQNYVRAAQDAWNWFKNSGLINSDHLINDGLDINTCRNNGQPTYTYNQGVILSGLANLYRATGDSSYLDAAAPIANAAISRLVDGNGILVDDCDRSKTCSGDGEQFKGVFTRGLRDLYDQRHDDNWKNFLTHNAQSIWLKDTSVINGGCYNGPYWGGPYATADASTQSCALDTLIGALAVTK